MPDDGDDDTHTSSNNNNYFRNITHQSSKWDRHLSDQQKVDVSSVQMKYHFI